MIFDFTGDNLFLTAARHYRNRRTSYHEFRKDLKRARQIYALFSRRARRICQDGGSENTDKINRIILNRIIIFFNLFSIEFAKEYLFHCVDEQYYPALKTILIFLSYMREDEQIDTPLDQNMIHFLREKI